MALDIGFASGQSAVEGGLGVGASTSKGVPADKRSLIIAGTVTGIGLTIASWSDDGDDWVEVAQTGVYVRSVTGLEPLLDSRERVIQASEANNPGGGINWDDHASPVEHQLPGAFGAGGVGLPQNADMHWFASNETMVVPGPYVDAPAESATIAAGSWTTQPGNLQRARINKGASLQLKIRSHELTANFGSFACCRTIYSQDEA